MLDQAHGAVEADSGLLSRFKVIPSLLPDVQAGGKGSGGLRLPGFIALAKGEADDPGPLPGALIINWHELSSQSVDLCAIH